MSQVRQTRLVAGAAAAAVLGVGALATAQLAPRGLPIGIVIIGLLVGGLNGLVAIGLVLVYRAGSYINFAQGGIGAVGALVAAKLITLEGVPYPFAVLAGLATAGLGAVLVERAVVQRLFTAPRLILTVATIGAAQLFGGLQGIVEVNWRDPLHLTPRLEVPWHVSVSVGSVLLRGEDFIAMLAIPAVAIALTWFLNRTDFGTALQAAAENPDRARLLGINVRRMSSMVWLLAGLLAGATAILEAPIVGFTFGSGSDIGLLLRALAPAMIGRLTSMPTAFVAALGLGVAEQAIAWNTDTSGAVDAMLLAVILLALLVRRPVRGRTADAEERSFAAASQIRPFPRELTVLPWLRLARWALTALPLVVVALLPLTLSVSGTNLMSVLLVYLLAAASLTVVTGFAGQVSFGQWALVGASALFGAWLLGNQHVALVPALSVTLVAGTVASMVVGLPALRIRGLLLGVTTLALAVACSSYLFTLGPFRPDDLLTRGRLLGLSLDNERTFFYCTLALTVLALVLVRSYRSSRWGRAAVAVRDNEAAASSYGVNPIAVKLVAFGLAGLLASLAGFLYALAEQTLNAGAFPVSTSLLLFGAVIIGGVGSVTGAVISALYLRGIEFFAPSLQLLTTSLGLLLVLVMVPTGIGGLVLSVRDHLLRRVAVRAGLHVPSLVADSRREVPAPRGMDAAAEDHMPSLAGAGG
jgi:branched-chain amino acid transport system permease protein